MQVLHYLPAGVPVNAAACLWAAERGAAASCRAWCRWQDFALMRSRAVIRGKFFASCIPKVASGSEKGPSLATYRRHASKTSWLWQDMRAMYPKSAANCLSGMHRAKILPGRAPFRCTDPSNHAYRADLAIRRSASDRNHDAALMARQPSERATRRRRTARAIASTAPPLWRGSLPRDGRAGRGRLLVWRGGAAKGVRGAVGHRALTEKPASAKRRLRIPGTSNFAESREPAFAGRVQGGAAARRRLSSGPAERGLLAACAKGCFGSAQAMPPTSKTRRSRARNLQHSAR